MVHATDAGTWYYVCLGCGIYLGPFPKVWKV
jgi:hypothetical protein